MQQEQVWKMEQEFIHHIFLKSWCSLLASLKSDVDKWDIDKLKNIPADLNNLKSKLDKLDVDKLVHALVNLSKLSDVVKLNVVEKGAYNAKIKNIEDKIADITHLTTKTTLNTKINKDQDKIPSITKLAPKTALTSGENKIPSVTNLDKKDWL